MSKKLQNIKAVKQMLDGTHKFQTKKSIGFSDAKQKAKKNERRKVGDIWDEEINGITYTVKQENGFRVKKPKNSVAAEVREYLNSYPNCQEKCCKTSYNHLDEKMRKIHGMCYDCVINMEHKLQKEGKYDEYVQKKTYDNAVAWLKRAEQDVKHLKQVYTEDYSTVANADGQLETWKAKMTPEEFEKTVEQQFTKFKKKFLKNLNKPKENND